MEPSSISATVVSSISAIARFANVVRPSASIVHTPSRASSTIKRWCSSLARSAASVRMLRSTSRMLMINPCTSSLSRWFVPMISVCNHLSLAQRRRMSAGSGRECDELIVDSNPSSALTWSSGCTMPNTLRPNVAPKRKPSICSAAGLEKRIVPSASTMTSPSLEYVTRVRANSAGMSIATRSWRAAVSTPEFGSTRDLSGRSAADLTNRPRSLPESDVFHFALLLRGEDALHAGACAPRRGRHGLGDVHGARALLQGGEDVAVEAVRDDLHVGRDAVIVGREVLHAHRIELRLAGVAALRGGERVEGRLRPLRLLPRAYRLHVAGRHRRAERGEEVLRPLRRVDAGAVQGPRRRRARRRVGAARARRCLRFRERGCEVGRGGVGRRLRGRTLEAGDDVLDARL